MIVYLIRHGGVENPLGIKYGRLLGFPLSEKGCQQVELLAKTLEGKGIQVIYASPLLRTKQTAEILAKHFGVSINYSDMILEVDHGSYQGIREEEYVKGEHWKHGGETLKESGDRILEFLKGIKAESRHQTIAVVSHEGPLLMAVLNLKGKTEEDYDSVKLPTAGYLELEF